MSYEGYVQILCTNGHESVVDCYENPNFGGWERDDWEGDVPLWRCHCGALAAWYNNVDTTNGSYCSCELGSWRISNGDDADPPKGMVSCEYCENGFIDGHVSLEFDEPGTFEVCNLGHSHMTKHSTYKIPKDRGYLTRWANEG